jgi:BirA family transcriptional regulator, biotin operon repressor / biotin---[acetyl-CoA-carboxylase] ligase
MDFNSFTKPVDFNIVHLDTVSSTNTVARELLLAGEASEGLIITAEFQNFGRGQLNNVWESEKGLNLLCSVVLCPGSLKVSEQVYLNMAMCLAVSDTVGKLTRGAKVKWPNDVYINDRKVAGILVENTISGSQIRYSIIGIGINVNQERFDTRKATSLKLEAGMEHPIEEVLQELMRQLSKRHAQLQLHQFEKIKSEYHKNLLGWQELKTFKTDEGVFDAIINGVDEDGRLVLQHMNEVKKFMVKQISML